MEGNESAAPGWYPGNGEESACVHDSRREPTATASNTEICTSQATGALVALASEINAAHRDARQHAARAVERALEAGDLLLRVKASLSHGQWLPWLAEHCPDIAPRTAQGYMRLARELPSEMRNAAHLTQRGAMRLLAAPQDDGEPIATQAAPDTGAALLNWLETAPLADGLYPAAVYLMDAAGWPIERMEEVLSASAARHGLDHAPESGEVRAWLAPHLPKRDTCCVRHHPDPRAADPEGAAAEELYRAVARFQLARFQRLHSERAALYAREIGLGELAASLEGAARALARTAAPPPKPDNLIEQACATAAMVDTFCVMADCHPLDGWHLPIGLWAAIALSAATEEAGLLWDACRASFALPVTPEAVKAMPLHRAAEVYLTVAMAGAPLGNVAPRAGTVAGRAAQ